MAAERKDVWASGDAYEPYVGRWSRLVAREFVAWLGLNTKQRLARRRFGHGCVVRRDLGKRVAAPGDRRRPFGRLRLVCAT